jgi:two-component system response regulator CpxR
MASLGREAAPVSQITLGSEKTTHTMKSSPESGRAGQGDRGQAIIEPNTVHRVLLVGDDVELCASLKRLLRMDGFEIISVHTTAEGAMRAIEGGYALIILDVMLHGGDGRLALRKIRTVSDVPVIMLTARGDEADRIAGLEAGADDYLPKPFNARELVARMRSVLKRRTSKPLQSFTIPIGDLEIQPTSRRVLQDGQEVALTGAEFDILLLLVRSEGKVVTRDEIAEVCLGRPVAPFDRSVDNHISNLRKKLGAMDGSTERLRSLRGSGYIYTGESKAEQTTDLKYTVVEDPLS